jgi:hypothetical protein
MNATASGFERKCMTAPKANVSRDVDAGEVVETVDEQPRLIERFQKLEAALQALSWAPFPFSAMEAARS